VSDKGRLIFPLQLKIEDNLVKSTAEICRAISFGQARVKRKVLSKEEIHYD
jgi:hypothetical protein